MALLGLDTLATAVSEDKATLKEVYEPFLIQRGPIQRTARGRIATEHAYRHLGYSYAGMPQNALFAELLREKEDTEEDSAAISELTAATKLQESSNELKATSNE